MRLHREAMRANVRASVNHLRHGSDVIERLAEEGGLLVVGSELDLSTGEVTFFDGFPRNAWPHRPARLLTRRSGIGRFSLDKGGPMEARPDD